MAAAATTTTASLALPRGVVPCALPATAAEAIEVAWGEGAAGADGWTNVLVSRGPKFLKPDDPLEALEHLSRKIGEMRR